MTKIAYLSLFRFSKKPFLLLLFTFTLIACGKEAEIPEIPMEIFEEERAGFTGEWNIDKRNSDDITAAIKETVDKASFLVRIFARTRLTETNTLHELITVSEFMSNIRIVYADDEADIIVEAPSNGRFVPWERDDGKPYDVSHEVVDGEMVIIFIGEDGDKKTIRGSLSEDGEVLTVSVHVSSSSLPEPLRYKLTYTRA